MTTSLNNGLDVDVLALGATPSPSGGRTARTADSAGGSWFEAVAQAWGQTLDSEAQKIETLSSNMGAGGEQPSQIAELSAESMRMNFLSNSESNSVSSLGQSLETMARKS